MTRPQRVAPAGPGAVLSAFRRSRAGATAIEYAVIAGIVAAALVAAVPSIAPSVTAKLDAASDSLTP